MSKSTRRRNYGADPWLDVVTIKVEIQQHARWKLPWPELPEERYVMAIKVQVNVDFATGSTVREGNPTNSGQSPPREADRAPGGMGGRMPQRADEISVGTDPLH